MVIDTAKGGGGSGVEVGVEMVVEGETVEQMQGIL